MIYHLINEGLSINEISRRTDHDRKTVRKYKYEKKPKRYKKRPSKGSILDSYKNHIKSRLKYFDLSDCWKE